VNVMKYDFDQVPDRRGTDSVKYDLNGKVFGTENVLPMWVADMDFEVADFIREAIARRLEHPVFGYTFRPKRFWEAAAVWMKKRHGWEVDPEAFSFSPGIVPALNMILMEYTRPGERIVIQPPVYHPFIHAARNHGRDLVYNTLLEDQGVYSMDLGHLEEEFRKGVGLFIFCNPHNPVGRVWKKEELEALAELLVRYGVKVISDEIHSDLILFGNRHIPLASLGKEVADLCFTCVAPSKTFNLAGLYTSAVITTNAELRAGYERILDAVHVGGGSLFGQVAFETAYREGEQWLTQLLNYLEGNFRFLEQSLSKKIPGIRISPLEATYLAWLDLSFLGIGDDELNRFMIEDAHLGLNHGTMFGPGGSGHQRMNIATSRSVLERAVDQLVRAVEGV